MQAHIYTFFTTRSWIKERKPVLVVKEVERREIVSPIIVIVFNETDYAYGVAWLWVVFFLEKKIFFL